MKPNGYSPKIKKYQEFLIGKRASDQNIDSKFLSKNLEADNSQRNKRSSMNTSLKSHSIESR